MFETTPMNRVDAAFQKKGKRLLSVYYTAGFPGLDDTVAVASHIEAAGADLVEIGMPFSDPVADGPTIQQSNNVALANGMTLKLLFEQLAGVREKVSIPLILMGYINPVLQYGIERFCEDCKAVGIDGLILPDLPMYEYMESYKSIFEANGLYNIFLVTPQTSEERIRQIDEQSNGFIYMVSSSSTTGAKAGISESQEDYFKRVGGMGLKNPCLIGFGISNHATFDKACQYADGAIIGSAFVNVLAQAQDLETDIHRYIKGVLNG